MIYNILTEQNGKFVTTGETIECEFEETQEVIDKLQAERGCCCALEAVNEQLQPPSGGFLLSIKSR